MLNGKYVSLESIVERVYRDTGFEIDIDWIDVAEWIGSVIDLINAPMQYIERITDDVDKPYIEIVNGRGELPCDDTYYSNADLRRCTCKILNR